jgi:hypothetical protein
MLQKTYEELSNAAMLKQPSLHRAVSYMAASSALQELLQLRDGANTEV